MALPLNDLTPVKDPKGGTKTPPRGIPVSQYQRELADMTREEFVVSLKEYFDKRLEEMDRRLTEAQDNAKEARELASAAQERRLDLLNEFRGQASDEAKKFALKDVVSALSTQVSMLYGGLIVVGVIGVANLVKLFFGH